VVLTYKTMKLILHKHTFFSKLTNTSEFILIFLTKDCLLFSYNIREISFCDSLRRAAIGEDN
jgi:hypothetical protein